MGLRHVPGHPVLAPSNRGRLRSGDSTMMCRAGTLRFALGGGQAEELGSERNILLIDVDIRNLQFVSLRLGWGTEKGYKTLTLS
jgi:hypothetical protein